MIWIIFADIMGKDISIETDDHRIRPLHNEVERSLADNKKAADYTKWRPKYASEEGLRNGLAVKVEWFYSSCNLKEYKAGIYNL